MLLLLNLCSFVLGFSCPDYCFEQEFQCKLECMLADCVISWQNCQSFQRCPEMCKRVLGNGRCDIECNIEECGWDSYECQQECADGCLAQNLGDGICNPLCDVAECNWDNGDCSIRSLQPCNCTGVTEVNPLLIYVSDSSGLNTYTSLNDALNIGACCSYNKIFLEKDTEIFSSQSINMITAEKQIIIESLNAQKTISLNEQIQIINGGNLAFANVLFTSNTFFDNSLSLFKIVNNAILTFNKAIFTNKLNQLVHIDKGLLTIFNSNFEGNLGRYDLITTGYCGEFCRVEIVDSYINYLHFNSSQFITATRTGLYIQDLFITNALSNSAIFLLTNSEIAINNLLVNNSNINSLMFLTNSLDISIENSAFINNQYTNYVIKIKNTENCTITNALFTSIYGNNKILIFQSAVALLQNVRFNDFTKIAISSENDSNLRITSAEFLQTLSSYSIGIFSRFSLFDISGSTFKGMENSNFTGIIIKNMLSEGVNLIENSTFQNCISLIGSAITAENANITVENCNFYNNTSQSKGGAIFIANTSPNPYASYLSSNNFFNNSAVSGGAIY